MFLHDVCSAASQSLRQEMAETRRERELARTRAERVALATLEYYVRRTPSVAEWEHSLRGLLMMFTASGSGGALDRAGRPARLLRELLVRTVRPLCEPRVQERSSYADLLIDVALASTSRTATSTAAPVQSARTPVAAPKSVAPLDSRSTTLTHATVPSVRVSSDYNGGRAMHTSTSTLSPRSAMSAVTRLSLVRFPSMVSSNSIRPQEEVEARKTGCTVLDTDADADGVGNGGIRTSGHIDVDSDVDHLVASGPTALLGEWEAEHCASFRPTAHPPPPLDPLSETRCDRFVSAGLKII